MNGLWGVEMDHSLGGVPDRKVRNGEQDRDTKSGQELYRHAGRLTLMICGFVTVLVLGIYFLSESRYSAVTMRLRRVEGTVRLEEEGTTKSIIKNLKLHNGNALNTDLKSLASISLDDTKLVTLSFLTVTALTMAVRGRDMP